MAFGVIGANIVIRTRIATLLIDARFVIGTIGIGFAFGTWWRHRLVFRYAALNVWRTIVAGRTRANRLMVDGITNRIYTACADTWICAFLIEARAIGRTVIVRYAFGI